MTGALAVGAALALSGVAFAATHVYRYGLSTLYGDTKYTDPVSPGAAGTTYRVITDAADRIVHVDTMRGGKVLSALDYFYAPGSARPDRFTVYRGGKITDRGVVQRDARARRTRTTWYTADGTLSSYTTRSVHGNTVDGVSHARSGAVTFRYRAIFNAQGIQIAETDHYSDTSYTESTYSPENGEELTDKVYVNGALDNYSALTYDAYGDVVRKESFDPDGKKFFDVKYEDGLPVRRLKIGSPQKITMLRYNADRLLTSATMLVNGKVVCKFVYDRDVDGRIKRTLAYSPSGKLWAEYPNQYVEEVERNGRAILGVPGTIYHVANWW
jgi:hypothetical protein